MRGSARFAVLRTEDGNQQRDRRLNADPSQDLQRIFQAALDVVLKPGRVEIRFPFFRRRLAELYASTPSKMPLQSCEYRSMRPWFCAGGQVSSMSGDVRKAEGA